MLIVLEHDRHLLFIMVARETERATETQFIRNKKQACKSLCAGITTQFLIAKLACEQHMTQSRRGPSVPCAMRDIRMISGHGYKSGREVKLSKTQRQNETRCISIQHQNARPSYLLKRCTVCSEKGGQKAV